jgi:ribosome-binding factor A
MTTGGEVKRAVRVSERVREELANILRGMRDPRLQNVTITNVVMTDDLQLAKVYVRALGVADQIDERRKKEVLRGLEAAGPRLRRDVSHATGLRYTPTLKFYYDEGVEAATRVEEILREIDEEKKRTGDP